MTTITKPDWRIPHGKRVAGISEHTDRAAWLRERRNGIGGTDAAALMGVHTSLSIKSAKDVTAGTVFLDKRSTTEPVEEDKNIFELGHVTEPRLLRNLCERFDVKTRAAGFIRSKAHPFMYASPDTFTSDGGIGEGKTASNRGSSAPIWLAGDVPPHAYIQGQHYLAVTGRSHIFYTVGIRNDYSDWELVPREFWDTAWFQDLAFSDWVTSGPFERNEAVIEQLIATEVEFWDAVQAGEMPDHIANTLELADRYAVARTGADVEAAIPEMVADSIERLKVVKKLQDDLKEERAQIETELKAEIGDGEYLTAEGRRVARWQVTKASQFDKPRLIETHGADFVESYTIRGTQRKFSLVEPKPAGGKS
jgi:predicted phage-related endonuclease